MSEPSDEELWGELDVAIGQRRGEILLELADRCFQRQDLANFSTLVDAAAEASASAGDDRLAAFARFNQGQGLMEIGEFDAAADCFLQAAGYFRTVGAEPDVAASHQRAGDAYSRSGSSEAALEQWAAALSLFETCDEPLQTGRTWMVVGGEQIARREFAEAEESFFAARTAFRQAASATHVAWADDAAAEALIQQGRADDAAGLLRSCVDIVKVGNDPQAVGYAALRLAACLRMLDDTAEALELLAEARAAFRDAEDLDGVARCDLESALALRIVGDTGEAEALLQGARSIFDGVGADHQLMTTDAARAELYLEVGRYAQAEAAARECLRTALAVGDRAMVVNATMLTATAMLEQDSGESALLMVEAHLGRPTGEDGLSRDQLLTWARVLMATGRYDDAQEVIDDLARQSATDSDPAALAQVRELRWRLSRARGESSESDTSMDADLTAAIALYLAAGDAERASQLSRFLTSA